MANKNLFIIAGNEVNRVLLHIPLGLLVCLLCYVHWALALIFATGFYIYEMNEDWHISDCAYKDIKGFLWGAFLGGIALFILKLLGEV